MKILFVAATEEEIAPIRNITSSHSPDYLITGPGMVATTYELTKKLSEKKYDLIMNIGLAGSFDRSIEIGEVVCISSDVFSELGAEDGNDFLDIQKIGLKSTFIFHPTANIPDLNFRKVNSITVNTVHGNNSSIEKVVTRLNPQTETMEGAAFFFVCEKEKTPSMQIRAISNYIERRNKSSWNIPLAIDNLGKAVYQLLKTDALIQPFESNFDNSFSNKKKRIQ